MSELIYTGNTLNIVTADGTAVSTEDVLATGMVIKMTTSTGMVLDCCTVVVDGDTNGDGRISVTDYLQVRAHLLAMSELQNAYRYAGDKNGDGRISVTDALQIRAHILGIA
jgi:hypothetical protein